MTRLERAALVVELADHLLQHESWCGETHIQKGIYALQALFDVPTDYEFILYKFGPYSFGLGDELTALRADDLIALRIRHPSYGPSFVPTETSREFRTRYPVTLGRYSSDLDFIARAFGPMGVAQLERVATALFVTQEHGAPHGVDERAQRLVELKPHVSHDQAVNAVHQLDSIVQERARSKAGAAQDDRL
jgi:hypothetical protein